MNLERVSTRNLSVGYQSVRWHDTKFQVTTLYPDAFLDGEDLIIPRFSVFDSEVSFSARLRFRAGALEQIELYPSIEHAISDWSKRKQLIVNRFEALAESNAPSEVRIEEDWSDVQVTIRRRPQA